MFTGDPKGFLAAGRGERVALARLDFLSGQRAGERVEFRLRAHAPRWILSLPASSSANIEIR